jgi:ABC-type uncharacterized transport system permease subunit
MNGLQLYFRLVRFSVRSQLAYRTSFVLQVLGQFLATFAEGLVGPLRAHQRVATA